jgi:hypothetical protein
VWGLANYKHVTDAVEKERVVPGVDGKGNEQLQRGKTTKTVHASAGAMSKTWAAVMAIAGEGGEGESKCSELAIAMAPKDNVNSLLQDTKNLLGGGGGSLVGWGIGLATDPSPADETRPPLELRPKKPNKKEPSEAAPAKKQNALPNYSSKCPPEPPRKKKPNKKKPSEAAPAKK